MAKMVMQHIALDRQVEQYLTQPIRLNNIINYSLARGADGITRMTLEIYVDPERFDQAGKANQHDKV
jgi:hypothetical protein